MPRYEILQTKDLTRFPFRDIRTNIVNDIKENIEKNGFYEARVLTVVETNGEKLVADGNHRLEALLSLGIETVPCAIYADGDSPYQLAVKGNLAEDVYAPLDLFDWLGMIQQLKEEGLTQKEIGKTVGWTRTLVANYNQLLESIVTQVLELTKRHQNNRVTKDVTFVTFNFTEGWFRNSGLYDLNEKYQVDCVERFLDSKKKARTFWQQQKLQQETAKYKLWQDFIQIAETKLHNKDDLESIINLIENNTFKTETQLLEKIKDLNKEAKNKLICGDALQELPKLEDASIDIVITDPPYGYEYDSWADAYDDHVGREGVIGDNKEIFNDFLKTCEILEQKTKPDAHLYVFCSWKTYPQFKEIIEQFFELKNMIVWDKLNHGAGDLEYNWGDRHELILFASKGKRTLNLRKPNIIPISRVLPDKHATEKPVPLIKILLEVSARKADTICDPFMGSGSIIKASVQHGELNYIGIEIDREIFERASASIGEVLNGATK